MVVRVIKLDISQAVDQALHCAFQIKERLMIRSELFEQIEIHSIRALVRLSILINRDVHAGE